MTRSSGLRQRNVSVLLLVAVVLKRRGKSSVFIVKNVIRLGKENKIEDY